MLDICTYCVFTLYGSNTVRLFHFPVYPFNVRVCFHGRMERKMLYRKAACEITKTKTETIIDSSIVNQCVLQQI